MDPVSAVGFVSAVAGIVDLIAKGVLSLSDFQSRYKIVDLKVSLMVSQLSTLQAALTQVGHLVQVVTGVPRDRQLVTELAHSLASVETIILVLDGRLSHLQKMTANGLSGWQKANFVWDEQTMRDYLSHLDHQVNALVLLLTALQCRTTLEQRDMLATQEFRHVLDLPRDETSSLQPLMNSTSGDAGSLRSTVTEDLATIHTRFDFDRQVFDSRAYQVATRANMIETLTGSRRQGISRTTHISGGAPQDAPDPNDQETGIGIAITTDADAFTNSDGESLSGDFENLTLGPETSTSSLVIAMDADSELPDFTIHTPDVLGRLTIQLGEAQKAIQTLPSFENQALVYNKQLAHDKTTKSSVKLSLLLRTRQQLATRVQRRTLGKPTAVSIPILGISGSGKSTLAKAARAGHGDIDESWRQLHIDTIHGNLLISLRWLVLKTQVNLQHRDLPLLQGSWHYDTFTAGARFIGELSSDHIPTTSLEAFASVAVALWNHPYMRDTFNRSGTEELESAPWMHGDLPMYLPDCAEHFLNSVERICKDDYLPSIEDVMWAQIKTTGTWKWQLLRNGVDYQFWDVGGTRPERKKWVHIFENVSMVVFTIDVSCYHQRLDEDQGSNRMTEQLRLWEAIVNSRWFTGTRIVVVLTKENKLTPDRLKKYPFRLGQQFPDYSGSPESAEDIIKYLVWILDGLVNRQAGIRSEGVTFCRAGTITESIQVWKDLLSGR